MSAQKDPVGIGIWSPTKGCFQIPKCCIKSLFERIECDLVKATLEGWTMKIEIGENSARVWIVVELEQWAEMPHFSKSCHQCFRLENAEDIAADVQETISKLFEIIFKKLN